MKNCQRLEENAGTLKRAERDALAGGLEAGDQSGSGTSLVINEGIGCDKEMVAATLTSSHGMPQLTWHTSITTDNITDFNVFVA